MCVYLTTSEAPTDYTTINSDLREIPSHQEVWLSPTTLTNIIFEINQFETSRSSDIDAAIYHFKDVIDDEDTLLHDLPQPNAVTMKSGALSKYPAYAVSGIVVSKEKAKSVLPADWEQTPQMVDVQTMIYQLVIRMKNVDTDLCVRINVPLKEFEGEEGLKEVKLGQEISEKVFESLTITNFGLFEG